MQLCINVRNSRNEGGLTPAYVETPAFDESAEDRSAGRQILRVMKITAILLLTACMAANAKVYSQISLSEKNTPLQIVFEKIEKQSGFTFAYTGSQITKAKAVSIHVSNATLEQVLQLCFKDQPFTYTIIDKTIVVKPKENLPLTPQEGDNKPLTIDISGRITDEEDNGLMGASVKVSGTTNGTTTDNKGYFKLSNVGEAAVLEISYVGFEISTISLSSFRASNNILRLKRKESPMNEIQVIAYGEKTKRNQIGNVASVKSKDISKQPVSNPLLALQGRVPGLFITQANGFPGSGVTVRIQGLNSIAGGNDPLYVIDGVPFSSQLLPVISKTFGTSGGQLVRVGGNTNAATYGNPLNYINPADIESIEVLKDADATAIYGSRAANGAILITTKKGKTGDQKIEFNVQQGWGRVASRLKLMERRQYLDMRYEALKNDGILLSSLDQTNNFDLTIWDTTSSTDWQRELIGNTASYADYQVKVSGGYANTVYSIGAGYHRETSVLPVDFSDQKGSLHLQLSSSSSNKKFKIQFSNSYMVDINRLPYVVQSEITELALMLPPVAPPLYNADGTINWVQNFAGTTTWDYPGNPVAQLLNKYQNNTYNLVTNLNLSYELLPGFYLKSSVGYTNLHSNEKVQAPLSAIAPELRPNWRRFGAYANSSINSWMAEPQLNYRRNWKKGKLDVLVGASIQQRYSQQEQLQGFGYLSDEAIDNIRSAATISDAGSFSFVYKYAATFGRVMYDWDGKYFGSITARRDGSSRFGANNQFQNFGSVGGAWIFSEEGFMKKRFHFLSFGKLKASYGTTGNDQIGEYQFLSLYNPISANIPYQGITTVSLQNLPNPYLQWEETQKLSAGAELGFLNDRLLLNVSWYRNRSSNQLLAYQLPITTGFISIQENLPATVQNAGWEFSLSTMNLLSTAIRWNIGFNLTLNRNKLLRFPGLETSTYANELVIGQPISIVKKFHYLGVDPASGRYYFDSKTDPFNPKPAEDANMIINTQPVFFGGIENTLTYKGIELSFHLQFVKQRGHNYYFGRFPGTQRLNQPAYLLDRWQQLGDIAGHERYNSNVSAGWFNANNSDAAYSDASYIRLKNVTASWQLPAKLMKRGGLESCRVFAQAQNLLTLTRYKGLDPETLSSNSLPPLRVLTIGLQVSL